MGDFLPPDDTLRKVQVIPPAIELTLEGVLSFCSAACRERFRVDPQRYLVTAL